MFNNPFSSRLKRRSGPLPYRNPNAYSPRPDYGAYDDRSPGSAVTRNHSKVPAVVKRRPGRFLGGFVVVLVFILWFFRGSGERDRSNGQLVVARDWRETTSSGMNLLKRSKTSEDTILILCPMKDSIEHIWHFFQLLDSLTYPRDKIQIGILVSDTVDRTYERALELADERQYKRAKSQRYSQISVYRKDFNPAFDSPNAVNPIQLVKGGENSDSVVKSGAGRHDFSVQIERRKLMAKSRSWLLQSALTPVVDWVLWLDVDVVDYQKNLIETLLKYSEKRKGDVIVPNCVWKTYNELGAYDRNNWAETPESLEMKKTLKPEDVLIEGYEQHIKTFRRNMAEMVPATSSVPEVMQLDGVGGCAALVRASLHRQGAIFPSWPVDHQLETEGFAQLAKILGGKLIGLPKYYVYHGLYG